MLKKFATKIADHQ